MRKTSTNKDMPKFSIIIVTYNSGKHIEQCLDSVCNQDLADYEIILIDNSSSDKTLNIISSFSRKIRLELNDKNEGFSGALNKGIRLSRGEYILTLNPDVILEYNFLSKVNRKIGKFPKDIGMIGVKILKKVGAEKIIDSTGLILSKAVRFFDRGSGKKDHGQYDEDRDILGPCAAAGIYKRDMLENIKIDGEYFDKDFFYLVEDFDVALRAKKRGWRATYLPGAICYHIRNGTGTSRGYRQYLSFRNRYFLIIKNIKINPYLVFYFIVYDTSRLISMLLTNRYALRLIKDLKQCLPIMLAKRKRVDSRYHHTL